MALQYNDLVEAQTKNPPQYGQQGQVISMDQLKPETAIALPEAKFDPKISDSLVAGVNSSLGSLDAFMKALQPQTTALDQTQNTIISRINDLLPQTAGRSQALAQEKQNQGLPDLQKQFQDLNNQINIGNAAYQKIAIDAEAKKAAQEATSRGLTTDVITGQQGAVERQALAERASKAAELAMLAARAQAVAGNINTAITLSEQSVEARFAPIEDELKIRQAQLEAIQPLLNKEEKQQALRQQLIIDERTRILSDEKANQAAINEMIINALPQGAPQELVDQASKAKNSIEAAKILGKYSGDYLKYELLKEQIKSENVNRNLVAERIKTEKAQQSNYYANIAKTKAETDAVNNPTQSVPSEYQSALSVILGSSKFTKEQKASITNAIQSGQNPVSVIKNQAKDIMGQTEATALSKLETAAAQLKSIDSSLKQFYAAGGKTGLFKGNYEEVVNKLGKVDDPKLVTLATQMAVAMQKYRLAVTGTASSVKEDARIENIFPGINNSQGLNQARLNGLLQSFDTDIESTYRNVLGSSYDEIKNAEASSDPNNPFNKALGGSGSQPIQGASILTGTNSDGTLNFNIPGYKPIGEMLKK